MDRPIARKAIASEPRPGSSEPSDAGFPNEGSQFGGDSFDFSDGANDLGKLPSLDDGDGNGDSLPRYSLDDFPEPEPPPAAPAKGASGSTPPPASAGSRWSGVSGLGFLLQGKLRKSCFAVLCLLVIASGIGVTVRQSRKAVVKPGPAQKITKSIKRSIEVSNFQEPMDLMVFVTGEKEKKLVSMQLEFGFPAENAYKDFQRDRVRYCDLAYQFATKEQPVKNTQRGWQEIMEKKFFSYLRANYPRSGLHSIRLAHWERL